MEHTDHYNLNLPDYTDQADIEDINHNFEAIDTAMYNMKTKQTAVSSPTSTGTAIEFINTVAQDANGKLTNLTKKTIPTFVKSGTNAAAGLVPIPSTTAGTTKYLREDATWQTPPNTTYSAASGGGLTLSSNAFSITNSGVTAGSYGPSANVTGTEGTTLAVPQITVNAKGQVTGVVSRTYTSKNTTYESKAAASGGTAVSLCTTGEKYTWNSKVSCTTANVKSALGTAISSTSANYFLNKEGSWAIPPGTNTWRPYQTKTYTLGGTGSGSSYAAVIDGNGSVNIKASDMAVSTPSGYAPVAIVKFDTDSKYVYASFVNATATGTSTIMTLKNTSSSERDVSPSITILYLKTGSP